MTRSTAQRRRTWRVLAVVSLVVVSATASWLFAQHGLSVRDETASSTADEKPRRFAITIRQAAGPPRVDLGIKDAAGNTLTAACSTCHATRAPNHQNRTAGDLKEFHQGLTFAHGNVVTCLACHNQDDYDTLALADGTAIAFADVMTLCSQCHGPQTRDYLHGAHGGMTGYWDLSRGPRQRNNCVDCHDPHAPAFPKMVPTFKPRDRFLERGSHASQVP